MVHCHKSIGYCGDHGVAQTTRSRRKVQADYAVIIQKIYAVNALHNSYLDELIKVTTIDKAKTANPS